MQAEGHLGGDAEDIKTAPFFLKLEAGYRSSSYFCALFDRDIKLICLISSTGGAEQYGRKGVVLVPVLVVMQAVISSS